MNESQILANAKIVVRELMSEPDALPLISASAVGGNGWQENLMQPITSGPKDHGSDGLLQWRLDRLDALQRLPNWNTLAVQCRFFKSECKAKYPTLWAQLVNPGNRTLANLTANICDMYEKPSAAGRVIDLRIGYANKVIKLFDAKAVPSTLPTAVTVPSAVPPLVAETAITVLNNIFAGKGSTILGFLGLIYAAIIYNGIHIPGLPVAVDWQPWVAFGLALVFGVGGKAQLPPVIEELPAEPEPKEASMDPAVIVKIITMIETLVPVIEKVISDVPQIKADVAQIKSSLAAPQHIDSNVNDRIMQVIQRLNALSPGVTK